MTSFTSRWKMTKIDDDDDNDDDNNDVDDNDNINYDDNINNDDDNDSDDDEDIWRRNAIRRSKAETQNVLKCLIFHFKFSSFPIRESFSPSLLWPGD